MPRARGEEWRAFASEHDCCLEPLLELNEALESDLVRAGETVVELDQPGARRPVRLLDVPVKLSRTAGDAAGLRIAELKREGAMSDMTPPRGRASAW
ncbi:MAG: CoA transferase [Solirubrobacteraceae bacterium]